MVLQLSTLLPSNKDNEGKDKKSENGENLKEEWKKEISLSEIRHDNICNLFFPSSSSWSTLFSLTYLFSSVTRNVKGSCSRLRLRNIWIIFINDGIPLLNCFICPNSNIMEKPIQTGNIAYNLQFDLLTWCMVELIPNLQCCIKIELNHSFVLSSLSR